MNNKPYFIFIIIVSFITLSLVGLLIYSLLASNIKPSQKKQTLISKIPSPTPIRPPFYVDIRKITLMPTLTKTPLSNPNKSSLIGQMPIKTPGYSIEYLKTSDTFVILILQGPYEQSKKAAENWLRNNGAYDLKTINMLYYKYKFVKN